VELLVVLAILAVSAMLASPALGRFFQTKSTLPPADQLMKGIAKARDTAILHQQSFRGFINIAENRFEGANGEVIVQLPTSMRLEAVEDVEATLLPCRFGPDGSGCFLMLRLLNSVPPLLLAVDPVTGQVRLWSEQIDGSGVGSESS
jgi:type II secretory pathway pseudopilin PulG